ncbi:MAG: AraC family transcriptional regulator [Gammaproteobacteria bacterium]
MNGMAPAPRWFVSSLIINELLRWARSQGLDPDVLIDAADIPRSALQDPNAQLDASAVERGMMKAFDRIDDPLIGLHLSPKINITALGVIGFIAQTSNTLGDLIQSINRFGHLAGDVGTPSMRYEPGKVVWTWDCHFQEPLMIRHATECILGCWAGLMRLRKQGKHSILLAVHFRHSLPAPELDREYQRFFGCPVLFDQPESGLVLPSINLSDPMSLADPNLHQMLALHAEQQLQAQQHSISLADKVRAQLRAVLAQGMTPVREDIADMLGMSGRSLHRKLEESGLNFRTLMDEVRLEIARKALAERTHTVGQLGSQLGFGDSQSFIRWFKKLEGITPGDYRAQVQA